MLYIILCSVFYHKPITTLVSLRWFPVSMAKVTSFKTMVNLSPVSQDTIVEFWMVSSSVAIFLYSHHLEMVTLKKTAIQTSTTCTLAVLGSMTLDLDTIYLIVYTMF